MGSLEHIPDYRYVARFLDRHLAPSARVYADFVTTREGRLAGAFLRKYIFPGITGYVELGRLVRELTAVGFNVTELGDDTLSCAWTVRDWARALQDGQNALRNAMATTVVRAFLLYLWSSHHFLATNGRRPTISSPIGSLAGARVHRLIGTGRVTHNLLRAGNAAISLRSQRRSHLRRIPRAPPPRLLHSPCSRSRRQSDRAPSRRRRAPAAT